MQEGKLIILLLLSSALLFTLVHSEPNHHHDHNNELYTSESTVELLNSGISNGHETPTIALNGTEFTDESSKTSNDFSSALGYMIALPIVGCLIIACLCYCLCKCWCACCGDDSPNVVVMQQSTTVQPHQKPALAPQITLQQPIIHQQAPPSYDLSQRWAQPPPQWGSPPQGTQYAPHPMGQQQHYSPNNGYDNAGFNPATTAPAPPYNTGQY